MNISKYKKSNIFVLYYFDHWTMESLAEEFNVTIADIQKVIETHRLFLREDM